MSDGRVKRLLAQLDAANGEVLRLRERLGQVESGPQTDSVTPVLTNDEIDDLQAIVSSLDEQREAAIGFGQFDTADMFRDQHAALVKLIASRTALSERDVEILTNIRRGLASICLSTPESRAEIDLLDRLISSSSTKRSAEHQGCVYLAGQRCRGNDRCQFPLRCAR